MERIMRYIRNLLRELTDSSNLAVEFFLLWIAVALTFLVIATILYYIQ